MAFSPIHANETGVIDVREFVSLGGVEFFERMRIGKIPYPPICALLGMRIMEVERGRLLWLAKPGEQTRNPMGVVHGGYIAALLDTAMGCAVHTALPAGRSAYTSLEIKVNFLQLLRPDSDPLLVEGHIVRVGRSTGTAEGKIRDMDGGIYAFGSTTCLILDPQKMIGKEA